MNRAFGLIVAAVLLFAGASLAQNQRAWTWEEYYYPDWMDDQGCEPAEDSPECDMCYRDADRGQTSAYRRCEWIYERAVAACNILTGSARNVCLDRMSEWKDDCEADADDAWDEALADCEDGPCWGDCY